MEPLPRITKRAAQVIAHLMSMLPDTMRDAYVPVVTWISDSNEPNFVPGPYVGGIEREKIRPEYVVKLDGMEIAYNLDEATLSKYCHCLLDHFEGRFIFMDPETAKLLNLE